MTDLMKLTPAIKKKLVNSSYAEQQSLGFGEYDRPLNFWKELNSFFSERPDFELFLHTDGDQPNLSFFSVLNSLERLKTYWIHELEPIEQLSSLKRLQIWETYKTVDLSFLNGLIELEELFINCKCKSKSFQCLGNLINIKKITIKKNSGFYFNYIKDLICLEKLELSSVVFDIDKWNTISSLKNLNELGVFNIKKFDSFNFFDTIGQLPNLETLRFGTKEFNSDFSKTVLNKLNIKKMGLAIPNIQSLDWVNGIKKLEYLFVGNSLNIEMKEVKKILKHTRLKKVEIVVSKKGRIAEFQNLINDFNSLGKELVLIV